MKSFVKTLVASVLLSSAFVAGGANAHNGYASAGHGDDDGYRVPLHQAEWGQAERGQTEWDGHDRYRRYDARIGFEIDRVQAEQRARIQQGIRSGELTPFEAARLIGEQREIERMQQVYMADSRLTPHERQRLLAELNDAGRNIRQEKHDAQDRDDFRRPWFAYR